MQNSKYPKDMQPYIKVLHSHFIKSATNIAESIPIQHTEIAILGRSNVGKSSLINLLLNHKLAKSSSTPGKTRLINFFATTWKVSYCGMIKNSGTMPLDSVSILQNTNTQHTLYPSSTSKNVNDIPTSDICHANTIIPLVFIDLPGFGFAKVDKKTKKMWNQNLSDFIQRRKSIKLFCHLIDSRHIKLNIDLEICDFLKSLLQFRDDCEFLQIYTKDDKLTQNERRMLQLQGKITISTHKKDKSSLQKLYYAILTKSFGMENCCSLLRN